MKEQRYIIVEAYPVRVLEEKVNALIEKGYQPLGSVITDDGTYIQAMFKQDMSMFENLTKQFGGI